MWAEPLDRFNEFDLVIVDEASQAPLTLTLIALAKGKRWIIVGDDRQLLPIFRSLYSEDAGEYDYVKAALSELSVFCVALKHSKSKLMLTNHYRSHPEIFGFSSREFYGGMVRVVSEPVGKTLNVWGFGGLGCFRLTPRPRSCMWGVRWSTSGEAIGI